MAGNPIGNPNLPTYLLNATTTAARAADVPAGAGQFAGGCNEAGSNANGVGINTGDFDPDPQNWPRVEDTGPHESQHIGGDGLGAGDRTSYDLNAVDEGGADDKVAFVQADSQTVPGGVLDVTTGARNETGKTVPANSWAWGVIPIA